MALMGTNDISIASSFSVMGKSGWELSNGLYLLSAFIIYDSFPFGNSSFAKRRNFCKKSVKKACHMVQQALFQRRKSISSVVSHRSMGERTAACALASHTPELSALSGRLCHGSMHTNCGRPDWLHSRQ